MTLPLVSVVLPTRGRPVWVRRAIRSVVDQDYAGDLECLVVHDQEEPDAALCDLGRPRRTVSVMRSDRAPGLAGARNAGRAKIAGSLVASCDDDDIWHPAKLTRQVEWLRAHPEVHVVGSGIRLLMPGGRIVSWPGKSSVVTLEDLLRSRFKELHSSTLLCRREIYEQVGGYDEELPLGYAEDYDWLLRAAQVAPLGVVTEPLADINKIGQSWFRERQEMVARGLVHLYDKHPEFRTTRKGEARILGQIAFATAAAGDKHGARQWAGRALRRWPGDPHALLALSNIVTGVDPQAVLRAARVLGRGIS
jgi:glycosyltransferase involved in cell wall biosynthesis